MAIRWITYRLLLVFFGFSNLLSAQNSNTSGIPKDTSFTVYEAYKKEIKNYPFIEIVTPALTENLASHTNIIYATVPSNQLANIDLHLNIYRPDNRNRYPALLMIHGGGWNSGDLSLQIPMAQKIAAKGYVTIPVEYRLIPEALFPAGLHDVKAAIRWIRANAEKYGIDPDQIAVSGCSAGGQLATLSGTTNGQQEFEGKGNNPGYSSQVKAVINVDGLSNFITNEFVSKAKIAQKTGKSLPVGALWLGGTYEEKPENWKAASSVFHVTRQSAPVCFINSSIPRFHDGREEMIRQLDSLGIYSEVHTLENTPHPFWLFHPWFQSTVNCMTGFLDKIFKPRPATVDTSNYDFIVAQDGTGNFRTIQEAIDAVPFYRKKETRIYIKSGFYKEKIVVNNAKNRITLVGENPETTVLTFDDFSLKKNSFGEDMGTSGSASMFVFGSDFKALNLTFENSAGPVCQAVAFYIQGDRAIFSNCRFLGFQDTLYASGINVRQYYENCYIEGTTDFIFGSATAWFEKCTIHCKKNSYITAANTPEHTPYGYFFNQCRITTGPNVHAVYLGRPWRPYSMTVFMNCDLPAAIRPEGWHNWDKESNEKTARYAEYNNTGPGANRSGRVSWSKLLSDEEIKTFTIENVMKGHDNWYPAVNESDNLLSLHAHLIGDEHTKDEKHACP